MSIANPKVSILAGLALKAAVMARANMRQLLASLQKDLFTHLILSFVLAVNNDIGVASV